MTRDTARPEMDESELERLQEEKRERLTRARQERADDMRAVMALAAGRRFVWRFLNEAGAFSPSYVSGDALGTAYNEGRRAAAMALQLEIQRIAARDYVRMMSEVMEKLELEAPLLPAE